ncbi:phosphatase PAP2 family protein [Pendulispora brunnea]|uniref:Phosphatase PAP2 family protein n=1 Tax=Pendulispora brunnea TaxID=2905690 RepID=A0ABZ2KBU2_9BACT
MSYLGWSRWAPLALTVQLFSLSVTSTAAAEPTARGPAYKVHLELDLPIVLVAGAIASSFFFLPEARGVACAPNCDRSRINGFDRAAAGLYDPTWSVVGDIATAATLIGPLVVIVVDEGLANGLRDDLVVAEAMLVTSALQVSLSYAVARPRPRVYNDDAPLDERTDANAARSFFSGHVADTVATSVAALRTFQRLGKPALGWAVFSVGLAGSGVVGVARVASGAHFPSDVIAGAAIGTGIGILLPAIHESGVQILPFAQADGGGLMVGAALP